MGAPPQKSEYFPEAVPCLTSQKAPSSPLESPVKIEMPKQARSLLDAIFLDVLSPLWTAYKACHHAQAPSPTLEYDIS